MSPLRMTQLTSEQALERGIADRVEISQRPRPTPWQVVGVWLENAGVGLGGALGATIVLAVLRAPSEVLVNGALLTGGAVFAGMMIWRGAQDELSEWRNTRQIRHAWKQLAADYDAKARRLQAQLDAALDELDDADQVEAQLRKALQRMTAERDSAMLEKKRALEQAQSANNRNFVRASNTSAQVVADAHEMLHFWFESNGEKWFSRNAANDFGWSDKRHRAAQKLLVDSGVVVINEKRPRVMEETIDAALRALNDHVARVDSVFVPDSRECSWDEDE